MPILIINSWQGMLGNSIMQVYNTLLIALDKKYNILLPDPEIKHKFSKYSTFYKNRRIIINEKTCNKEIKDRYNFYYQKWLPAYKDCFKKNHDKAVELLKNILTICDEEPYEYSKETLIIHMRSGDIFSNCPHPKYIPPPLSFYKNILNETSYKNVLISTENSRNPCLKPLEKMENVRWTGGNLEKDIKTIMGAKHLIFGIGSFVPALLLLSNNIEKIYVPSNYGIPGILEGERCLFGKKVEIVEVDVNKYMEIIGTKGVRSRYARDVMLNYPDEVPVPVQQAKKGNNSNNSNKSEKKIDPILSYDEISDTELKKLKLKKIAIRAGQYLDGIMFAFDNNKHRYYGGKGGKLVNEIELEEGEVIKSVQHIYTDNYMGFGVILTTSKNNTHISTGKKGYSDNHLKEILTADKDEEIIGLKFKENLIIGIETRKILQ